ncbi:MAG TPA: aspartyl protease family protein [Blastocatellia bacterium]|nr:aspartyl protease family protein [Blastocatellia bacterium]
MKVKGIESAKVGFWFLVSGFWLRDSVGNQKPETRNQKLFSMFTVALLLALGLALAAAAPRVSAEAGDRKEKDPNEKYYRQAKKAIRDGKYEKAVEVYAELLDKDGRDIEAHLGISLAYAKQLNFQNCYDHANKVIEMEPNNARAHALAGLALLRSGYVPSAVERLVRSVTINPKEALAFGAAAEIDYYEGRARDAHAKAYHAYTLDPDEPDYLVTLARASSRLERFADAADAYEQFLRIAPQTDKERRERIQGLIDFYRQLVGVEVHQVSGANSTNVPFDLGADRRPYITVKINGRDATFVIDTGSGFTVISKDAAKRFGVSEIARGGKSQGVGGDGKFPIIYGLIKSMQLGEARLRSVPCFIRPFHGTKERPGEIRSDGFIGLSVLAHFLTELDYKDSFMRLNRQTGLSVPLQASVDEVVVPFRTTQNGLISIETELDGNHRINAILDSGASSTVISTAAVDRLKMRDQIIKGQTARVIGAAGVSDNVELLFIRNCRVSTLSQNNMRALVLDFGAINETSGFEQSGILGGDFLRHYRVTIDFSRAQVMLKPHTSPK